MFSRLRRFRFLKSLILNIAETVPRPKAVQDKIGENGNISIWQLKMVEQFTEKYFIYAAFIAQINDISDLLMPVM